MTQQSLVARFRAMAEALENNPALRLVACEFNPPATEDELEAARETFDLTPAMVAFYGEANGLTIQWESRGQEESGEGGPAAGYIDLRPVQEVFGDWADEIYFEEGDEFEPLHPLDFFVPEACAALYLDGAKNPEVYYHYLGEEMRPLGVDFKGYLELLLKSRGFWYWQTVVAKPAREGSAAAESSTEKNFWRLMPRLFPDFDAAAFK